jgi:hypothetical protein
MAVLFLVVVGTLVLLTIVFFVIDRNQTHSAVRRNYPVIGRLRHWLEHLGEFFRLYFFAMDREELPFNRAQRTWVYRAAKNIDNTRAFGSTRDLRPEGTVFFVNTGNSVTTRATWLWTGQPTGGAHGTWRTTNSGVNWVQVEKNEGAAQIYQPDTNGVVFMAGVYSDLGSGVLRSKDYGQTWIHVGANTQEAVAFGTTKNVYSMYGFPSGPGNAIGNAFQVASQPGTGIWVAPGTPAGLTQGPAQIAVVNDGTHNIFWGAMYNAGLWRYVEP